MTRNVVKDYFTTGAPRGTTNVSGRMTLDRRDRGRVIWVADRRRLYVLRHPTSDPDNVFVFEAPEQPMRVGDRVWETSGVLWYEGPCGCGYPRELRNANWQTLADAADAFIEADQVSLQPIPAPADA
jgi:hypothetical protein